MGSNELCESKIFGKTRKQADEKFFSTAIVYKNNNNHNRSLRNLCFLFSQQQQQQQQAPARKFSSMLQFIFAELPNRFGGILIREILSCHQNKEMKMEELLFK
jgi:hypothetical protein